MIIELVLMKDGRVMLVTNEPFPDIVKRVEYYSDQKLLNLVYHKEQEGSDLMHREVPEKLVSGVEKSPEVLIYTLFTDHDPIGYKAPLIRVGGDAFL